METVFESAYRRLSPEAARLYRLLGLLPGNDFTADLAAALAGGEAGPQLGTLLETHLVEEPVPGRYRLHDLVRLHAAHAADGEPAAERDEALRRAVAWYSRMVAAADHLITGERFRLADQPEHGEVFTGAGEALDWLDDERGNLLALLRRASMAGWDQLVWQSAEAMWALYAHRRHYADWLETSRLGVLSAHRLGDRAAEARLRNQTARALVELSDYPAATAELNLTTPSTPATPSTPSTPATPAASGAPSTPATPATSGASAAPATPTTPAATSGAPDTPATPATSGAPATPDAQLDASTGVGLRLEAELAESRGLLDLAQGRADAAAEWFAAALRAHEHLGDRRGAAVQTYQRGRALDAAGRHRAAARALEDAARLAAGDELTQAKVAIALGPVYRRLGRTDEAGAALRRGAAVMRARRIPSLEALAWAELSELAELAGDEEARRACLREAIELTRASGNRAEAESLARRLRG
ncbi:hypothetical protein [Nonomuraea typhae]|uniref:Tetratricopeptide repeat protein n=1 Tax=Nonomuraea typhae TaxID=2603600 RepID=A0ABW7YUN1_9ACTN